LPSEKKTAETHVIDPKYLLNDQQMCDYITQGFLVLKQICPAACTSRFTGVRRR
jgi:hypothetical protein